MNCHSCGKTLPPEERRCPHCGNPVSESHAAEPGPSSESLDQTGPLEELLQYKPSALTHGGRLVMMLAFGLVFAGLAIFFFIVSARRGDAPPIFQVFAVIFGLGGLAMAVGGVWGLAKITRSPLERLPAVVLAKREKPAPRSSGETTIYFLTIQTEDGPSKEHTVSEKTYEAVDEGDTGVAYLKGGYLLDFKRVRLRKA